MSECCGGTGLADYAAVPCPNKDCPVPMTRRPTTMSEHPCCGEYKCRRSQPIEIQRGGLLGVWYAITRYKRSGPDGLRIEAIEKHELNPFLSCALDYALAHKDEVTALYEQRMVERGQLPDDEETVPPRVLAAEQRRSFRDLMQRGSLGCDCGHMLSDHRADDYDRGGNPIGRVCRIDGCECGKDPDGCCENNDGSVHWPYLRVSLRTTEYPTVAEWGVLRSLAERLAPTDPDLASVLTRCAAPEDTIILGHAQVAALRDHLTEWLDSARGGLA